ncbi:MAG: DUF2147 domain-containing protein [Kordiimonadaceae bacterium]|nr:DUF2147 domain-containing protein [Kordiimonadaceae bacterium]MBO6569236.1 DUF2147 domain-containing protein [Kordiimonadaceae bacterium]MBO6964712.1 DUF2147 domain-containing protein [Kordiimonadaceae bacterium]
MARQLLFLIAFFTLSSAAFADGVTDYYGLWWNEDRSGIFELQANGDSIEGITRWGKGQDKDVNNPDPELRTRDLKGISFLYGFEYVAKKNRWKDGKVYDPGNGKTYSAKMELEDDGATLKMRGYVGISLLGRTARFERVNDAEMPPELRAEMAAR